MKAWLRSNRGFLVFLAGFLFFRTAVADWNPVPSGSMRPAIVEGDVVLVERIAYDWKFPLTDYSVHRVADPRRGDIVVFSSPLDGTRLIKRVVALPGDKVELRDDVLVINGQEATYGAPQPLMEPVAPGVRLPAVRRMESLFGQQRVVQQLPDVPARRNFGPITLGKDEFFMMGDNRDNSADSRVIGPVPRRLINGQATRILVSADITAHWMPRWDRIGSPLQ